MADIHDMFGLGSSKRESDKPRAYEGRLSVSVLAVLVLSIVVYVVVRVTQGS